MLAQDPSQKGEQVKQTFEKQVQNIALNIENITKEEKAELKKEVDVVNDALANGSITKEGAERKKEALAQVRANNIETRIAKEQEKLEILVQKKVDGQIIGLDTIKKPNRVILKWEKGDKNYVSKVKNEKRTTSQFVFAIGANNLATGGAVANSDFRYWKSRFYEWGFTFNSRIIPNHNLLHAKYGLSLMYNDLKPTNNRLFVENGSQTVLVTNPLHQDDSRFRNVNLVVPLHLEFDFTKPKIKDGKTYFKSHDSFRLGIGGYFGANVKSKQILKYDLDGYQTVEKTKGDFNVNDFIYGLSTYLGYKSTSLYLKYDMNPLFKDNMLDQNNISLGVRFDFN
jgi:hypothetical protein